MSPEHLVRPRPPAASTRGNMDGTRVSEMGVPPVSASGRNTPSPAEIYAAMDGDTFHRRLKISTSGVFNPGLAAEAVRRARAHTLRPTDLRLLLLGLGNPLPWHEARRAALEAVARAPQDAASVLAIHSQLTPCGGIEFTEQEVGPVQTRAFTARAAMDCGRGRVEGETRRGRSRRVARHTAALSLLARLAALPEPRDVAPDPTPAPSMTTAPPPVVSPSALDADAFHAELKAAARRPAPDPRLVAEARARAASGLEPRDAHLLLFVAIDPVWARCRADALAAAHRTPGLAGAVLGLHVQARDLPPVLYIDDVQGNHPGRCSPRRPRSPPPAARSPASAANAKKAARHRASADLLAFLTGVPCPDAASHRRPPAVAPDRPVPLGTSNPVGTLNERAQRGEISETAYTLEQTGGPAHAPVFSCTATTACARTRRAVLAEAFGTTKADAHSAAAALLLERLAAPEKSAGFPTGPPPAGPRTESPAPATPVTTSFAPAGTEPQPPVAAPAATPSIVAVPAVPTGAAAAEEQPSGAKRVNALWEALRSGCAVVCTIGTVPADTRLVLCRDDGKPMPDAAPDGTTLLDLDPGPGHESDPGWRPYADGRCPPPR